MPIGARGDGVPIGARGDDVPIGARGDDVPIGARGDGVPIGARGGDDDGSCSFTLRGPGGVQVGVFQEDSPEVALGGAVGLGAPELLVLVLGSRDGVLPTRWGSRTLLFSCCCFSV